MNHSVYILLLESDRDDAEEIRKHLKKSKLEFRIKTVESCKAFARSLTQELPDIVLSDYVLPDGDGFAALRCLRKHSVDIPFIFVANVLGEERAVAAFTQGATDFVLKFRLSLLVPAVMRALREANEHAQRMQAEHRFRDLSSHLQKLLEGERTRIARLVHDELGQSLATLKMDLAGISGGLPKGLPGIKGKIRYMMRDADHVIQVVRKIITDLRPGILDDLGILAALEWQAADFQKRTGIKCVVTTTLEDTARHPELDTVIFRTFQGLLANILQHADSTEVRIHSTEKDGEWVLVVEDNGRGMPSEDSHRKFSFGILGMRERASEFGGTITYGPIRPHGTRVTLHVPLRSAVLANGGGV
ncbi:MAG: response regulator [Opitutales bacterium]|nr:response regulator [Opitutales bacterium]